MKAQSRTRPFAVGLLIFLQVFLGIQGIFGGVAFILAPDGSLLQMPFSQLKNTPFSSFLIPGILLFLFLGVYPLAEAYGLWKRPAWRWPDAINPFKDTHWSWAGSLAAGVIAVIWILVQTRWITWGALHTLILVMGLVILGVTLLPVVRGYLRR